MTFQPAIAALILAAGQSSRMGQRHKVLDPVGGVPMLERVVNAAEESILNPVIVVTGRGAGDVATLLEGRAVTLVHNAGYRDGIASSLQRGLASLPSGTVGVMILLADMPFIQAGHINQLAAQFNPAIGREIIVPARAGRLGNPVIWSVRHIPQMMKLAGDRGARSLLERYADRVWEVAVTDDAIFDDVDTPQALARANTRCRD